MFTDPARPAYHEQLAAQIARHAPRVLALCGPGGYEKRAILNVYAQHAGPLIACDVDRRRSRDLAGAVLDALVARDRSRVARSAADRLAYRADRQFGTARDALRREWDRTHERELLLVRDADGALATPAGADLLGELIATLPADRTLALTTRAPLPPALAQRIEGERTHTMTSDGLALSSEIVRELARNAGVSDDDAAMVHALCDGWPLVSRLLLVLIQRDGAAAMLRDASLLPRASLLTYAGHRVVAAVDERVREAIVASVVRPGARAEDLVRVLGDGCDDTVLLRLRNLPFVTLDSGRAFVHPDICALIRARFAPLVDTLYERTIRVLVEDGSHGGAARVALESRDPRRAAELLEAAPPYTTAPLGLRDYERVLDRIDPTLVTSYPNMWMATIPFRRFSVDRETYVREAETVYFCLPYSTAPDKRAAALMHLASAYFNLGRVAECDDLIEAALDGFAAEPTPVRASLLNFAASLCGERGKFSRARALAQEAAALSNQPFAENLALHHIEANEAVMRGRYDRVRVIFDELMRRQSRDDMPLYFAYSAVDGAFWAWAFGDDAGFARLIATLEDALTPGLEAGFARIIEAAHGRPISGDDTYAWPIHYAIAQSYRMGHATDRAEALDAARAAARAADERRDPMLQILFHAALYVLDEPDQGTQRETLTVLATSIESPELQAAVGGLVSGGDLGMLEPFVRRRLAGTGIDRTPPLVVQLFAARIQRNGKPIRVSGKELELLALLAAAYGPLSRERIGEALWEHLDPEEWGNNLKVTLSRLRAKLGARDAILLIDGSYRLSREVDVDLRRYESAVRERADVPLDERTRAVLAAVVDAYRSGAIGAYERLPGAQAAVARINDTVCAAGSALAEDALAAKRYDDALAFAHVVAGVDALSEAACELSMKIHLGCGDADAARREFRRYSTVLAAELGAAPTPHLAELARAATL